LRGLGRVRAHDIRFFDADDQPLYASPPSVYKVGQDAPDWFVRLVRPEMPVINLPVQGGNLTVTVDPSRSIVDAWDDLRVLLAVILVFLVAVNVLVFFLIGRSLRPVASVLHGLKQMERGDYAARLPRYALPEFDAIGHTFNGMASALQASTAENTRLALIAQQSGDAIFIHDLEGNVSYWNPAAERLLGWAAADIVGHSAMLITPDDRRDELLTQSTTLRSRGMVDHVETQRLTRDGRRVDVALSAAPLVDPERDEVIGEICSLRDITEVKRAREAEAQLADNRRLTQLIQERLEEERRVIARELHDELGQCVTAIRTIGTVIATQSEKDNPDVHRSASTIVSVAGRIYDTVHDIIRQLRPSQLDHLGLRDALEDVVGGWRRLHPDVACRLDLEGELDGMGELVNITVYRIVQECLTNIAKHARATAVEVRVIQSGSVVAVRVRDDGRGINGSNGADATRFGLLGMRERVEGLGGHFAVDSSPGEGMTVLAQIPLAAPLPSSGAV
ncbi:MAG: PAS domain S-box protein, partial [Burkholderiales bacterium]|nr:PAS domain S-box protein [Burkholderiales bacterium]